MAVNTLFGQAATGSSVANDAASYTMGMQFTLSQPATLTGIWFYSAPGANGLPAGCAIYLRTGAGAGSIVAGSENDSPSWSGAAGSGWVRCAYASGPALAASTVYKVVILKDATSQVYSTTSHYWDSGPGASGLTSGIITAPNSVSADNGNQDSFGVSGSLVYPDSSFSATNYWIDVEVTTGGTTVYALGTIHYHNPVSGQDEHVWLGGARDTSSQAYLQTPASLWSATPLPKAQTRLTPPPTVKPALYDYEQLNPAGW
jgi:hypothetical protein